MTFARVLTAAMVAILATGAAIAQGHGMASADTNGDGLISKAEATAQANARFDALDLNKDGVLSADERSGPGSRMLDRADSDGDGKISRAEYLAQADKRFTQIDANGDGQLSKDELASWRDRARSAMTRHSSAPADAPAPIPSPNPGQ